MQRSNRNARRVLIVTFILLSVAALNLPFYPVGATSSAEFCERCEADCYAHADGVKDYNVCVLLCNYAGNCNIPIIQ